MSESVKNLNEIFFGVLKEGKEEENLKLNKYHIQIITLIYCIIISMIIWKRYDDVHTYNIVEHFWSFSNILCIFISITHCNRLQLLPEDINNINSIIKSGVFKLFFITSITWIIAYMYEHFTKSKDAVVEEYGKQQINKKQQQIKMTDEPQKQVDKYVNSQKIKKDLFNQIGQQPSKSL